GSPQAWEIQLKPGVNAIGRAFANDFKLTDVSVSGCHCHVTVEDERVTIKDLGSTNGTYVDRTRVSEATLQSGSSVHLGGLEMLFYSDEPGQAAMPRPMAAP